MMFEKGADQSVTVMPIERAVPAIMLIALSSV
jgi:hypothetical protein